MSQQDETFRPVRELYMWPAGAALLVSVLLALGASGLFSGHWFARPDQESGRV